MAFIQFSYTCGSLWKHLFLFKIIAYRWIRMNWKYLHLCRVWCSPWSLAPSLCSLRSSFKTKDRERSLGEKNDPVDSLHYTVSCVWYQKIPPRTKVLPPSSSLTCKIHTRQEDWTCGENGWKTMYPLSQRVFQKTCYEDLYLYLN